MFFRFGDFLAAPPNFLQKMAGTKENYKYNRFVSVGYSFEEFAQHQENKNKLRKTQRDVSLLKKFLVSRNEPRELENIDARDPRD